MQNVVIDQPYVFEPPHHGTLWPRLLLKVLPWWLGRKFGITQIEVRGQEHLQASLKAGHGIMITPNHSRPGDPLVMVEALRRVGAYPYLMSSWHAYMQNRLQTFVLRHCGAFSVYREGMDRQALNAAIEILATSPRPLVIFAEGVISRTNDLLGPLMEGPTFIARAAAKQRAKASEQQRVVIHPAVMKFRFRGNLSQAVRPALAEIERRLTWRVQDERSLIDRIYAIGQALLTLKEMEYIGATQSGTLAERLSGLINAILTPLENEWVGGQHDESVVGRVKRLRIAILPDMVKGDLTEPERDRRWRQLADMYLAQQLSFYPPDYIAANPSAERMLETVERFEEDLTDDCRIYPPLHALVEFGPAIEVDAQRPRGQADPLTAELEATLTRMVREARPSEILPIGK